MRAALISRLKLFGAGPLLAFSRRDYSISRSYRLALVLDVFYGLINLLIFYFIARTFPRPSTAQLGGAPSYFAFVAVGIVITLVVSAMSADVGLRLREEQLTGTLETVVSTPVRSSQIAVGMAGFPFAFAIVRAAVYMAVAGTLLGVDLSKANWSGLLFVLVAGSLALLGIGIVLGAAVVLFKRGNNIVGFAGTVLGFAGGAYFPLAVLPGWLEAIGKAMPTRFLFDGVRSALFEGSGWGSDVLILLAYSLAGLPLALWAFSGALARAKRHGALAEY